MRVLASAAALSLALIVAGGGATAGAATAQPSAVHECQHPVLTGVEVSRLHHISIRAACRIALDLHGYATEDHTIVACTGRDHNVPVLKLHRFEGWRLRLHPYFRLVSGRRSFATGGTDFPASC